jgi:hypothetical protein
VARPAARQKSFADLEPLRQGVRLEPVLQAICDFLNMQPDLVERVRRTPSITAASTTSSLMVLSVAGVSVAGPGG